MRKTSTTLLLLLCCVFSVYSQVTLEGYVFEEGNRGFLNMATIKIETASGQQLIRTNTDLDGIFKADLPLGEEFIVKISKDIFANREERISTINLTAGEKLYLKVEMKREPGYVFDVTIAEKRKKNEPVDAITGTWIEVFNNTADQEDLVLKDHEEPAFKCHFKNGNHYTIMIRKDGYFNKRMEAYVNVNGCILCFDGVGEVKPGVSDVLTEGHSMGTLLANVEMIPIKYNKAMAIENIYYDYNSSRIKTAAKLELDKLVSLLKDNPSLVVELGSHTDSRGDDKYNRKLSQKRAESAVKYITEKGGIISARVSAKGYGESKLRNRCKNGVECSEARHQRNRRTELKVVGRLADPNENRSLKDIIAAENFDDILKQIQNEEVIEIKEGEALPDEIAEQLGLEPVKKEEVKVEVKEEVVTQMPTEPAPKVEKVKTPSPKPTPVAKKEEKEVRVSGSTNYRRTADPMIKKPKEQAEEEIGNGSKILSDLEVSNETRRTEARRLPSRFTGYMVEFFASSYELPASHEIFSRHGKVYIEQKKDGTYAYLFGTFEEWRDANKFLQSLATSNYRSAEVVRYKKGNRLNR